MKSFDQYFKIAEEATDLASNFLYKNFGDIKKMHLEHKKHCCIADDKKCNKIYEKFLKDKTPEASIYSEEGEKNLNSDLVWIIDPIDGTSNYRVGIPLFATQICLLYKNETVLSIIKAPILKMNFTAQKNKGAYLNGKKINVSKITNLKEAMIGFNKGASNVYAGKHILKLGTTVRTVRIYGSMGIDLAYLASGKLDALINYGSKLYDYAPGLLLIKEAGGVAINFKGNPWQTKDKTLIVSNKILASKILKIM